MQLLAQNRSFQMWVVEPAWFATNNAQGLFAPIPMHNFHDEFGIGWNFSLIEQTMRNGVPHGFSGSNEFSSGVYSESALFDASFAGGVYFNMRLLEEAGIPRDLPFTLQRENNWTWETFTELARPLSRDFTGNGLIDQWAITTFHQDFLSHALASNGAAFAAVDPVTGKFVNTTTTDAFREAVEWTVSLRNEALVMHEDDVGGTWDAFVQMFNDGYGAMRIAPNHVAGNLFLDLPDDWGFVSFPRGPRSDRHFSWVTQNILAIPYFYSAQEVDDMMFAIQRWIRPLDTDSNDAWMGEFFAYHRDPRSVTETMVNFTRNPAMQIFPAHVMMPGLGHTLNELFAWRVWLGTEPSVIIDEAQPVWNAYLERMNNL
jgi:hypothetical protein